MFKTKLHRHVLAHVKAKIATAEEMYKRKLALNKEAYEAEKAEAANKFNVANEQVLMQSIQGVLGDILRHSRGE